MAEKEYIERVSLLKQMEARLKQLQLELGDHDQYTLGFDEGCIAVDFEPAADVVEVKHGYWILWKPRQENRNATYKCSVCGKLRSSYYNDVGEWKFCPCGAKMDGERKEQL